jgi:hypothetical protein
MWLSRKFLHSGTLKLSIALNRYKQIIKVSIEPEFLNSGAFALLFSNQKNSPHFIKPKGSQYPFLDLISAAHLLKHTFFKTYFNTVLFYMQPNL